MELASLTGALLRAKIIDNRYKEAVGNILQMINSHGLLLIQDARLAQIIFHKIGKPIEGYSQRS